MEPITIHGDGAAARDWLFIEDTAEAVDMAIHSPIDKIRGEALNIGTGKNTSVLDIARMVIEIFGLNEEYMTFMDSRFGQVQNHISSTEKAERLLGFRAKVSFIEGLLKTVKWYKDNRHYWEKQITMRKVPVKNKAGEIIWY